MSWNVFAAAWFTETAWPPIVLLCVLSALSIAVWSATKQGKYLVGSLLMLALCVALFFVEKSIVTEAERVEERLYAMTEAVRRQDADATRTLISPQAKLEYAIIPAAVKLVKIGDDLRITDVDVELQNNESRATSHFRANGTIGLANRGRGSHQASRWMLSWRKEAGEWKIFHVQQLHVLDGRPIDMWSHLGG